MSRSAELLGRLAPKARSTVGSPTGGIPELTQADIAAALRGASDLATWYALAKYADDWGSRRRLFYALSVEVVDLAIALNYTTPKAYRGRDMLRRIAQAAIDESIRPSLCAECRGSGAWVSRRGVIRPCGPCQGTGKAVVSETARAQTLEIGRSSYMRLYAAIYEKTYRRLSCLEIEALERLHAGLDGA